MANIAKFDRGEVIDRATRLFWAQGFHATSTRDLQSAIDMRPGSIYAAFGSKTGLFQEALRHYAGQLLASLDREMASHDSVRGGLRAFFRKILLEDSRHAPSELCLLARTLSELDDSEQPLLDEARELLDAMEAAFRRRIESAIARAELPADASAPELARELQVQIIGLRSYLRASGDREAVSALIDRTFERLFEGYSPPPDPAGSGHRA